MDKIKQFFDRLLRFNFTSLLVSALVIKAIVLDISYAAFLITIPVLAYEAYKIHLQSKIPTKIEVDTALLKELDGMKSKLNALTMERGTKPTSTTSRYF